MPRPPRPLALPVQSAQIPDDLKNFSQWVTWRYTWQNEKWDKPPRQATGDFASSTDSSTWSSFDQALKAYQQPGNHFDGIGFAITEENALCGIDLDHCRNPDTGDIEPWAQAIVDRIQTYTEVSPSGTGLRLFAYGQRPKKGRRQDSIEVYSWGRYLTVTGCHLIGMPSTIEPRQVEIEAFEATLTKPEPQPRQAPDASRTRATTAAEALLSDDQLLEKALSARNGAKLSRLWSGDTSGYDGDDSRADQALCCELAFWTQDEAQIDRLFRRSGLYREKWERADYRDATITNALNRTTEHYNPQRPRLTNGNGPSTALAVDEDPPPPDGEAFDTIIEQPPQRLPWSDQTNAETLVRWYGSNIRYCNELKQWLFWDGRRWDYDTTQQVMRLVKATIKRLASMAETLNDEAAKVLMAHVKTSLSATHLKAMVTLAESEPGIAVKPAELDRNPWLLNCLNGTVDLRTGKLNPHQREDWLTKCLNIPYISDAECPNWLAFLRRVMDDPQEDDPGHQDVLQKRHETAMELVSFLQRAVGYSLTGVVRDHALFFLYGGGQNGKSTFSETMAALFGDYFQKAPTHLLMLKERANLGAPSPELARLFGVRMVMACEIGEGQRLNETQVKDLTGDDMIVARNLYKGFIEFRPTYKLWMYGNHKPTITGTDEAIWRRPKLIPFTVRIPDSEVKPDLREKHLLPELPGILAWAVQGCIAWNNGGLQVPDIVTEATKNYRQEMDVIGQFIDDDCTAIPAATVKAGTLYAAYCKWCEINHEIALKQRTFGVKLAERGFTPDKGTAGVRLWKGVGLTIPPSSEEERWSGA